MVRHHVRSFGNNKIMAIKLVRELTGIGLREAKDAVEQQIGFFVRAKPDSQERIADEARRYGIEFDPPLDGTVAVYDDGDDAQLEAAGAHAVRFVSGSRLIHAIKLVRELTGLGLKEAKQVVDERGLIRTGLSRSEAEDIVSRFAAIDSRVDLIEPKPSGSPSTSVRDEEDDYDF